MATGEFKQKKIRRPEKKTKIGASDRIRTGDSHVGNVILYQLSYTRSSNEHNIPPHSYIVKAVLRKKAEILRTFKIKWFNFRKIL